MDILKKKKFWLSHEKHCFTMMLVWKSSRSW